MKVALNQPTFYPWIGYFDLIDTVNVFVFYDNVEWEKQSFHVRNIIYNINKKTYINIGVDRASHKEKMNRVRVSNNQSWRDVLLARLCNAYRLTPYFEKIFTMVEEQTMAVMSKSLSEANACIIEGICRYLGINTQFRFASELGTFGGNNPQERVLAIAKTLGTTDYYNFKHGIEQGLYKAETFKCSGIRLWKQDYRHPRYDQIHTEQFSSHLSILDILFHRDRESLPIIRRGRQWVAVN